MTEARDLAAKLAKADPRRIARWIRDRLRDAARRILWHAAHLRMHARAAMRGARRLPPGSLRATSMTDARTDDRFYLEQFRRHGPVFKLFWGSGHLKVCVVGFPLARRLLSRHRGALRPVTMDITSLVPAQYLRSMGPELHPKYRRLFKGAIRDDLAAACEPELRVIIRRELAHLVESTTAAPPATRLYATLDSIALRSLLLLLFGVRPDSELAPVLEDAYHRLGPDGHVAVVGPEQTTAFHTIRNVLSQILKAASDDPASCADSILGRLQDAPEPMVDETAIGNAIYMVERGRHDLRDLLRWVLKYLSADPGLVDELRAGLAPRERTVLAQERGSPLRNATLAEACVLETLRLDQAEVLNRKALEPLDLEGFHVPKHSWVAILMRESHRDPDTFADPDAFRPHRFLERTYSGDEYSPFGIDEHQCIAGSLVKRIGTLFVEELVTGFSWSVASDGPRRFGHFHWEPSPSFAIDIRRVP